MGLTLLLGLARWFVGSGRRAIFFYTAFGKWVTDLACVHGLQRSRFLLRPLPSGRASLAVSILYHLNLVISIGIITKYQ